MRIQHILTEATSKIEGTNCDNCSWKRGAKTRDVEPSELNVAGGLKIEDSKDLKNARNSDLVTLPGYSRDDVKTAFFCEHRGVKQWVTGRMCCIFWDAPGVIRDFKKSSKMK